jgi:glucose-fructose oxidoreductase
MSTTVADCDAMIAACRAAGVKLSLGYRLHFDPRHLEIVRLAREKDFGAFERMNGAFGFHAGSKTWRLTQALGGGGPLMDVGIYVIQSACMAAGEIAPVAATAHELPKTRPQLFDEVEETIAFTLEFPGGVTCDGRASFTESYNRFRAEAPRGWAELEPAFSYGGLRGRTSAAPIRNIPGFNQQAAQMDAFAGVVINGGESTVPGEMGRRDIRTTAAIYESARTGKRVEIAT